MKLFKPIKNFVEFFKNYSQYVSIIARANTWDEYGVPPMDDTETLVKIPEIDYLAYVCIDLKANDVASLPMKFFKGYEEPEEIKDHPLIDLLMRPNPWLTNYDLIYQTIAFLEGTGECYWALDEISLAGAPNQNTKLHILPAYQMKPVVDSTGKNFIVGFKQNVNGKNIDYEPEEVVYIKNFHYRNPFRGISRLAIGEQVYELDYYAREYNKKYFKNFAQPGLILQSSNKIDEAVKKRIAMSIKKEHGSFKNAFKVMIMDNDLKVGEKFPGPKDLDFEKLLERGVQDKATVAGVPPALIGHLRYANYANVDKQTKIYWQSTIIPLKTRIEATINELYIPRWFPDEEIWLEFDTSKVEALQEDEMLKANISTKLVSGKIFTINEAREHFYNKDPIEGGDELQSFNPLFGVADDKSFKIKSYDPPTQRWFKKDAFRRRQESKFYPVINEFFEGQKDRIIKALSNFTDDYYPNEDEIDLIFTDNDEAEYFVKLTKEPFKLAFQSAGIAAYEEVEDRRKFQKPFHRKDEIVVGFDISDPAVLRFIEQHGFDAAKFINATTKQGLRDLLAQAYQDGLPIRDVAKSITDWFDDISSGRAYTITQTEIGNAVNSGTFEGYKQAGADKKAWLATPDEKTRDSHWAVGQEPAIPLNEAFRVGSSLMMHPNDPAGPAEEIINCRCALEPEVEI